MSFTIGADPELFVGKNHKFISAHGMVQGTKRKPYPVEGGSIQVDGMALEYNLDPCKTEQEFVAKHHIVQDQLIQIAGGPEILPTCTVEFTEADVKDVPALNFELGCSVDFNAYTGDPNPSPNAKGMMRTAGGHVHIGTFMTNNTWKPDHIEKCMRLTRLMDKHLGIYSLLWDKDVKRREMYGKAGCFRPAKFGVEYRTLSNLWIFDDKLIKFVYQQARKAYDECMSGGDVESDVYAKIINQSLFDHPLLEGKELG